MGLQPDQEIEIANALLGSPPVATVEILKSEGITTVSRTLGSSPEDATTILDDLTARDLIRASITQGGQLLADKPMPVAKWFWASTDT